MEHAMLKFIRDFSFICLTGCLASCSVFTKRGDQAAAEAPGAPAASGANHAQINFTVNGASRKVIIRLRPELAPQHVDNFRKQIESGSYNGLAVHRAIRGYLVQMGDPLTRDEDQKANWGTGGVEGKIPSEANGKHTKGAVAMARLGDALNADKGSSDRQFYVMLRSTPSLDGKYSVFGEVTQGLDVLEQIASQVVDSNDVPVSRVEITSARLLADNSRELTAPTKDKNKRQTQSENEKGEFTRFIERIW
jgi:cyclophilin family peptidyl-prolyl cis-trans isomerase